MKNTSKKTKRLFVSFGDLLSEVKRMVVSRMFWGRGSFYKNMFHVLVIAITVVITLGGFVYRVADVNVSASKLSGSVIIGSDDLLQQGGSISTILPVDNNNLSSVDSIRYTVASGDTLASIAQNHNISMDTIRWANPDLISPFTNDIQVGWTLTIPKINGVLYTVKPGQSLDAIIALTSVNNNESNKFNIVEFNQLSAPYNLNAGQKLFIPDGNLIHPDVNVTGIPHGVFINPASSPDCAGYIFQRGFTSYHDGIDLSKWDGCRIEAIANGTVYFAGWENLSGYCVKIDHGGGIHSYYYHASDLYVKTGQRVQQGDPIMYMGSSGNSTGTHLHFSLGKDGVMVDPQGYVPY